MKMKNSECNKCGSTRNHVENRGVHVGLYCDNCGTWLKWLSKKEADKLGDSIPQNIKFMSKEEHEAEHKNMCIKTSMTTRMLNRVTECCNFNCGAAHTVVSFCPKCGRYVVTKDNL